MKGQFKKASAKSIAPPHQIILPNDEDVAIDPELEKEFQSWRYGCFMIVFNTIEESSMIIDLNGSSFVRHLGSLDEVLALVGALLTVRVHGQPLYPDEFTDLEDDAFIVEGMDAMEDIMSAYEEPDEPDPTEVYNTLKSQFVNELIKPPKKDN